MAEEPDGLRRHFIPGSNPAWLIGARGRHRGSLHGDIWQGTAADLASRGVIAIYPTAGWWKTRRALKTIRQGGPIRDGRQHQGARCGRGPLH